jgi:hypothetical protein
MLTHVIISQQLGGYTASTFPAAIYGHRVEQVAFTKLILKTGGKCCVESAPNSIAPPEADEHELTHAGKANIVHRKDIRHSLIKLLCNSHEPTDRPEILVAENLGIMQKSDIILSHKRLSYLDELCDTKGIVVEPVIFQMNDGRDKKKASILGDGSHYIEKGLYWTLGGYFRSSLARITFHDPDSPNMTYCIFGNRDSGPNVR